VILRKIWTIFLLAGLLSGCKTSESVEGCVTYSKDKGWVTHTGQDNPVAYLECIASGATEMAHFPYILQSLKASNAGLLKKYKTPANIRAVLKEEEIDDETKADKGEKSKFAGLREGDLSHLLHWMLDKTSSMQQGIAIYNSYGGLEAAAGGWDLPLYLRDQDLAKLPTDPKISFKVIVSLTPLTEGMYAVVIPIRDAGKMLGWMISYYKF
jgi:hypothetical protein